MNYSAKITGTDVSPPNVVLALSLYVMNVQENPPLVREDVQPLAVISAWCVVTRRGPVLNFLISTAPSLDANEARASVSQSGATRQR